MTLQASGAIGLSQVNTELALTSTATITMNDTAVRTLSGTTASSQISFTNFYGKSSYAGIAWTARTAPASAIYAATWSGTTFVAGGFSAYLYTSTTGTNGWTSNAAFRTAFATGGNYPSVRGIATNGGSKWVVVGDYGSCAYSGDSGATWTRSTSFQTACGGSATAQSGFSVAWTGTNFVAIYRNNTTGNNTSAYSTDGNTWSVTNTFQNAAGPHYLFANGTALIIAASSGYIYYSTDNGVSWGLSANGSSPLYGAAYSPTYGTYVVAGQSEYYSSAFPSFTNYTSPFSTAIGGTAQAVCWNGTRFVAAGINGICASSMYGSNSWQAEPNLAGKFSGNVGAMAYGNSTLIVLGDTSCASSP